MSVQQLSSQSSRWVTALSCLAVTLQNHPNSKHEMKIMQNHAEYLCSTFHVHCPAKRLKRLMNASWYFSRISTIGGSQPLRVNVDLMSLCQYLLLGSGNSGHARSRRPYVQNVLQAEHKRSLYFSRDLVGNPEKYNDLTCSGLHVAQSVVNLYISPNSHEFPPRWIRTDFRTLPKSSWKV